MNLGVSPQGTQTNFERDQMYFNVTNKMVLKGFTSGTWASV